MESVLLWLVVLGGTTGGVPALMARSRRFRLPVVTIVIAAITLAVSAWGNLDPEVLDALRRDRDALADGEWWRLGTPLVVQDGGWAGTIFNIVTLLILGAFVECLFGRRTLLGIYLSAGLVSEGFAYTLLQHQGYAGNSVAVMGLAGLLAVAYLRTHAAQVRVAGAIALLGGAGLIVTANLHGVGFAVGALAGIALMMSRQPQILT
jgi:membrane associated rhomboid family serine protease